MTAHDPDLHHRRSIRLNGYDYTQHGAYFVTIYTYQCESLFGTVNDETMSLNENGQIAVECWDQLSEHFPQVEIDEFVVMPNHVHGIIVIVDDHTGVNDPTNVDGRGAECCAPTDATSQAQPDRSGILTPGSLVVIARSYKSAVTKQINLARQTEGAKVWQRNYYEQIIRSAKHLAQVRQYVQKNPLKWALDRENPSYDRLPTH